MYVSIFSGLYSMSHILLLLILRSFEAIYVAMGNMGFLSKLRISATNVKSVYSPMLHTEPCHGILYTNNYES